MRRNSESAPWQLCFPGVPCYVRDGEVEGRIIILDRERDYSEYNGKRVIEFSESYSSRDALFAWFVEFPRHYILLKGSPDFQQVLARSPSRLNPRKPVVFPCDGGRLVAVVRSTRGRRTWVGTMYKADEAINDSKIRQAERNGDHATLRDILEWKENVVHRFTLDPFGNQWTVVPVGLIRHDGKTVPFESNCTLTGLLPTPTRKEAQALRAVLAGRRDA
jgi:hypothetical protein